MVKNLELFTKELEAYNDKCEKLHRHSAWSRGVSAYTEELICNISEYEEIAETWQELEKQMLNGANHWTQYSYCGCSLCYNGDICKALCNNTEKKRTDNGRLLPNSNELWLDVQARALSQAAMRIIFVFQKTKGVM